MNYQTQEMELWYERPAKKWTEALSLGNGRIGAMVYGNPVNEKICLNEDTLWSGYPKDTNNYDAAKYFKEVQQLSLNGENLKAQEIIEQHMLGPWSQSYLALGDIEIDFFNQQAYSNYKRTLDLETALSTVQYECNGITYNREMFVSSIADAFIMKISASEGNSISFKISIKSQLKYQITTQENSIILDGECPTRLEPVYIQSDNPIVYSEKEEERGIGFRGIAKVILEGGSISKDKNSLSISFADSVTIVFTVKTSFNGFDKLPFLEGKEYKNACLKASNAIDASNYNNILKVHIDDYRKYFERAALSLGTIEKNNIPTDQRLRAFSSDKNDLALYTLLFNFGRYLIISSSRKGTQPTNLQGIWNSELRAPWSSNYTVNINTQMNYWPVLMCNLQEFHAPLLEMIKELSLTGSKTAKIHYNTRGFTAHHNIDLWRLSTPVGQASKGFDYHSAHFAFWNMSAAWLCRHLFEHYEFTMDKEFLKNEAYPLMKQAALFCIDILIENADGFLLACPSTSPENSYNIDGTTCPISATTTMTMSIIKDLFKSCIKSADIIGEDIEFQQELERLIPKLYPYQIGEKGQLLEWDKEYMESEINHRHISHLYGLYPANEITMDKTPALAEACKKSLILRGDKSTGWSLAWKVNCWARLQDGNHALMLVDKLLNLIDAEEINYNGGGGIYMNMFDAHPPFQIDGNFGITAGIVEMLLQSHDETIHLFPALPDVWSEGFVKGLVARKNVEVRMEWKNHQLVKAELISKFNNTIKVKYIDSCKTFDIKAGESIALNAQLEII